MNDLVLHVITGLQTGGAENALVRLLAADDRDRRVPLVVSLGDRGAVGPRLERLGVEVVALGMRPGRPSLSGMRQLVRLIRSRRPAVIQGWMYHGNLVAAVAARLARSPAPLIWNVRHSVPDLARMKSSTALVIRLGKTVRSVRRIIYNSSVAAQQHEALGYPAERTIVIPNGFDTTRFCPSPEARASVRRELGVAADATLIGLVARYHPDKDHATFLAAANDLLGTHDDVHFVLIGPGVEARNPQLASKIAALKPAGRVHLLGEREAIARYTAAFDVATSSSATEAFPNAIGEALACGVPCVATDVGDVRDLVGDEGLIVPPGHPAALAQAWRALLAMSPAERSQRSAAGRERILRDYGLERVVSRYASVIEELLVAPARDQSGSR